MGLLSDSERKLLENNSIVEKVTASNVTYTSKFKIKAVAEFSKGISPNQIFSDAGIDLQMFGKTYAKKCLSRWRKIHEELGNDGLKSERRGSGATGRPVRTFKSPEDELHYLRAENDFLKKLHALAAKYPDKKNSR
jgi:transposase